jgi:hypothetical protein
MNPLTLLGVALGALGLVLFVRGRAPLVPAGERDPLVRGAGLVLTVPAGVGLVVRFILARSGMGAGAATILTAALEFVSLLVCATLAVLLCASAGGPPRGPSAA